MKTASFGVFPGPTGETFVSVRKGDKGIPLASLLPKSAQGDGYGKFPVAGYFDYVQLWLATPKQWSEFSRRTNTTGATEANPVRTHAPGFDLDAYHLIDGEGVLDYPTLTEVIAVIARLWDHEFLISPQAGLFYNLFRTGLSPGEIFNHIAAKAAEGQANEQGVLQLDQVRPGAEFKTSSKAKLKHAAQRTAAKQLKKKRKQGRVNRKRGRR